MVKGDVDDSLSLRSQLLRCPLDLVPFGGADTRVLSLSQIWLCAKAGDESIRLVQSARAARVHSEAQDRVK